MKNQQENAPPSIDTPARKAAVLGTPLPWNASPSTWKDSPSIWKDSIAALHHLLLAEPVNLRQLSDEIRAYPDLEGMIMKLGGSLTLPLDIPPCTVEEATIALGTDRLRVLVYALSLLKGGVAKLAQRLGATEDRCNPCASSAIPASDDQPSTHFEEAGNLETLYLAGFLHWLGLDSRELVGGGLARTTSQSAIQTAQASGLTDVFMRDFVTLIPFLEPALLNPPRKAVAAKSDRMREKETK